MIKGKKAASVPTFGTFFSAYASLVDCIIELKKQKKISNIAEFAKNIQPLSYSNNQLILQIPSRELITEFEKISFNKIINNLFLENSDVVYVITNNSPHEPDFYGVRNCKYITIDTDKRSLIKELNIAHQFYFNINELPLYIQSWQSTTFSQRLPPSLLSLAKSLSAGSKRTLPPLLTEHTKSSAEILKEYDESETLNRIESLLNKIAAENTEIKKEINEFNAALDEFSKWSNNFKNLIL